MMEFRRRRTAFRSSEGVGAREEGDRRAAWCAALLVGLLHIRKNHTIAVCSFVVRDVRDDDRIAAAS